MSLVVWLPLDGDLKNLGTSGLQFTNENTTNIAVDSAGKIGKCYKRGTFQTAGRIVSNETVNLDGDISMCCWAKVTNCVGDTANGLISNHAHDSSTGCGITVKQISTSDYRISCNTGNGSSGTYHTYYGTTNIKDAWHHLALTYSSSLSQFKLWVDGKLENTVSYANKFKADNIVIFDWSTAYNAINYRPACSLNDIRIYNHCLSPLEVKEISRGLTLHWKLDDRNGSNINLVINGYGELGKINWSSATGVSTDVPSGHSEIKQSFSGETLEYIPINSYDSYQYELYIKGTTTSGTTYPSLLPYDVDKNFIQNYHCPAGFNLSTMTTISQVLKPGDTKIYVTSLANWNANSGHYYNVAAIFSYKDSTGYVYANGEYTQNTPRFGTSTNAKTNLDKTNNVITLNSAYTGPQMPVGTAICASTDGATYYYPFGGITLSTITDWTYKSATFIPRNVSRLKYAKYLRIYTYPYNWSAGIKLTNTTLSSMVSDSSGYSHHGAITGTLTTSSDTPRYSISSYFGNVNTPSVAANNAAALMPALTNCTITWWAKNDTTRTLFFNGQDGSHYACASNANTFYHKNIGSPTMYRDGVAGTYTCEGGAWHFYVLKGANLSSWTSFRINTYTTYWSIYGLMSDVRIYSTALSDDDIKLLYSAGARVDNLGGTHTFEFNEKLPNLMWRPENARAGGAINWSEGLGSYTQANCQVTCDKNGYRIYRPPNLTVSANGNTMWGGLRVRNSTNSSVHVYNAATDNIFGITKGHTYVFTLTIKGKSSNDAFQSWIGNNMGRDGGSYGLACSPTNTFTRSIGTNFNGETQFIYKFTVTDDVVKTCTTSYSSFVQGNQYLTYMDFRFGFTYQDTGTLGTDLYISNIGLYDITNIDVKINKDGVFDITSLFENRITTKMYNSGIIESKNFIEL